MKIIFKNIIIGVISSCMLISCDKFLEEKPTSFIDPASFYTTVNDFDGALKGLYSITSSYVGDLPLSETFAWYSDKPESAEQTGDIWINNPGYTFYVFRNAWGIPYSIINNANSIIAHIEGKDFSEVDIKRIIAEAKFFRAFAYFELVQYFGDIPYRDKSVSSVEGIAISRTTQNVIYGHIFDDMQAALDVPETSISSGRINKSVVKAMLSRMYLTSAGFPMNITENYAKAKQEALDVIAGSYQLVESYDDCFKTPAYTSETIWAILFDAPNVSSGRHTSTSPIGSNTAICLPSDAFINSFSEGDMRKEWGIKDGYTNKAGKEIVSRTYYNKFIEDSYLEDDLPAAATSLSNYHLPLIRLSELYLIAAEAENEMNGPAGAFQYINKVRERARVDKGNVNHVPDLAGLSKEELRDAILDERAFELHLEGRAWFDMKRTQTFDRVQKARGSELKVPINTYNNTWLIPDTELTSNNIPQNPLYQ